MCIYVLCLSVVEEALYHPAVAASVQCFAAFCMEWSGQQLWPKKWRPTSTRAGPSSEAGVTRWRVHAEWSQPADQQQIICVPTDLRQKQPHASAGQELFVYPFILHPLVFWGGNCWRCGTASSEFAGAGSLESHDGDDAIMGPLGRLSRLSGCHGKPSSGRSTFIPIHSKIPMHSWHSIWLHSLTPSASRWQEGRKSRKGRHAERWHVAMAGAFSTCGRRAVSILKQWSIETKENWCQLSVQKLRV